MEDRTSQGSAAPLLSHQSPPQPYSYFPSPPSFPSAQESAALVLLRRRRRRRYVCFDSLLSSSSLLAIFLALALLASALFLLWPSDPAVRVVRLRVDHLRVSTHPAVSIDVGVGVKVKIQNRNFFSFDYDSLVVSIGYRGKPLGSMRSDGGHLRARGMSYIDADVRLDGVEVLHDVFYLIEDLAKGSIPFDTITEVQGQLHFLSFDIPIKGKFSCAMYVNPKNHTVIHQDCYPE